jgi:hypothetical protein
MINLYNPNHKTRCLAPINYQNCLIYPLDGFESGFRWRGATSSTPSYQPAQYGPCVIFILLFSISSAPSYHGSLPLRPPSSIIRTAKTQAWGGTRTAGGGVGADGGCRREAEERHGEELCVGDPPGTVGEGGNTVAERMKLVCPGRKRGSRAVSGRENASRSRSLGRCRGGPPRRSRRSDDPRTHCRRALPRSGPQRVGPPDILDEARREEQRGDS